MRIENLVPDAAPAIQPAVTVFQRNAFADALDAVGSVLNGATRAEDAFAAGTGDLQTAVYERARAGVALSVATAAAQRAGQALQSILNMQV